MKKIEQRTLTDQAYDEITLGMVSGRFVPGQPLIIRTLADAYGISATPIREALQRLVAEHRLEMLPNRSIIVPVISKEKYMELALIRRALEGLAVELATPNITPHDLIELERVLRAIDSAIQAGSSDDYVKLNQQFHFMIYEKSNSPLLLKIIRDLWSRVGPVFNQLFNAPDFVETANAEHENIYAALKKGNPVEVRESLLQDISVSAGSLLRD